MRRNIISKLFQKEVNYRNKELHKYGCEQTYFNEDYFNNYNKLVEYINISNSALTSDGITRTFGDAVFYISETRNKDNTYTTIIKTETLNYYSEEDDACCSYAGCSDVIVTIVSKNKNRFMHNALIDLFIINPEYNTIYIAFNLTKKTQTHELEYISFDIKVL